MDEPTFQSAENQAGSADSLPQLAALKGLLEVTRRLAAELDLEKVLAIIADEACQAMVCERASLYRFDPEANELYSLVAMGLEIDEVRRGLGQGISGYAATHRTIVNVADPPSDPRWSPRYDELTGYRTRSILAAPLISPNDGALLGVIEVFNNVGGPFDSLDEELIVAFAGHAAVALDRARMHEEAREREQVEAALNVARDIQRGFMPGQLAHVPGYELASWWYPQQAVGGDYCDVIPLRNACTALVIADVSGHGIGPSLLMASVRAALKAMVLEHSSPHRLLCLVAKALAGDFQTGNFITMVLAVLDPVAHTLEFANAGHAPALHYRTREDRFEPLESTGLPLGVLDEPDYPPATPRQVAVGDIIVLCTDGIVEAMDEKGEAFGQERLEAVVRRHASAPLIELARQLGASVERFYVGDNPADDLTILVARRNT